MPTGIDVSNNNGSIDWSAVASSGIAFAIAKVTEGAGFFDRYFPANWQGMKANNILRGGYHFARPSLNGAIAEADFCLASINQSGGLDVGDLVVLDLEDPDAAGDLSAWTLQWLQHVESAVGYRPILYSGRYYLQEHGCAIPAIAQYPLWLAAYQGEMPANVPPWPTYLLWQYSDSGTIPGVRAAVDMDTVYNLDELRAYGKPGTTQPAPPPPPDTSALQARIVELEDQVAALSQQRDGLINALAYLADNVIEDQNKAQSAEARRVRTESIGPRPQ